MSWTLWAKVVDGEIVETSKSGDLPKEFFFSVNGHSGDHENVGLSISLPAKPKEAKEVEPK